MPDVIFLSVKEEDDVLDAIFFTPRGGLGNAFFRILVGVNLGSQTMEEGFLFMEVHSFISP